MPLTPIEKQIWNFLQLPISLPKMQFFYKAQLNNFWYVR